MVPEAQAAHFRSFNSLLFLLSLLDRQMLPLCLVYLCHEVMQGTTLAEHVFASFPTPLLGLESNVCVCVGGFSIWDTWNFTHSPHVWCWKWLLLVLGAALSSCRMCEQEGLYYWWGCIPIPELNGSPARMWVLRGEGKRVLWPLSPVLCMWGSVATKPCPDQCTFFLHLPSSAMALFPAISPCCVHCLWTLALEVGKYLVLGALVKCASTAVWYLAPYSLQAWYSVGHLWLWHKVSPVALLTEWQSWLVEERTPGGYGVGKGCVIPLFLLQVSAHLWSD